MSTQKFQHGDLVRVADDLGPSMRHFTGGVDAIVIGSYADQYGGDDRTSYTLHLKGQGQTSWYYESQLSLIERDRKDLCMVVLSHADPFLKSGDKAGWLEYRAKLSGGEAS